MNDISRGLSALIYSCAAIALLTAFSYAKSPIPADSKQLIVGVARDWNDSHVTISRFERRPQGWVQIGEAWPGRLGSAGLAWGRGLHPQNLPGLQKREGDKRAPAGVFSLGGAYGDIPEANLIRSSALPYYRVTPGCLWVEDPASPHYNRHIQANNPESLTAWEKKQQMKQNDPAHEIKLLINHNTPPNVVSGAGSSIFFSRLASRRKCARLRMHSFFAPTHARVNCLGGSRKESDLCVITTFRVSRPPTHLGITFGSRCLTRLDFRAVLLA